MPDEDFLALCSLHITQRVGAMQFEEYTPEIIPIISGNAKLMIDVTPQIAHTIHTVDIASTVVTVV